MNTVLFVTSHLGAGYNQLTACLNEHPRMHVQDIQGTYKHISDVESLIMTGHKAPTPAAIYGDILLLNYQFCCEALLKWCKFIFLIRSPKPSLDKIIASGLGQGSPLVALRYYSFRLRRICEMAKRTPGSVVIRWRDILEGKAHSLIYEYFRIKGPPFEIKESADKVSADSVPYEILQKAEDSYERHLYYLKHLQVRRAF